MSRSQNPDSSPLLPIPQHTPHSDLWRTIFVNKIEHDDPVWKEYLEAAQIFDLRILGEWNSFLDVILVFIGLFITVLTSFVIETQKTFSRDPAKVTNELLRILILNASSNNTSIPEISLGLDKVTELGSDDYHTAVTLNALLFVSLAFAIATSVGAMMGKLWLIQYISWVRKPWSPYDRAMKRQEAFSGFKSWKFHWVINSLPLFALVAVFLFAVFIYLSIHEHHKIIAWYVGKILQIAITTLLVLSCSAAFIPSSPFRSPFSHIILCFFNLIPTRWCIPTTGRWRIPIRWRTIVIGFACTATAFVVVYRSPAYQALIFVLIACAFAVARTPKPSGDYSPFYGPPGLMLVGCITVFTTLAIAAYYYSSHIVYALVSFVGFVFLGFCGFQLNQITRLVPDTLEAEAVAWLLESSSWQKPELFTKAGRVASTPQRKVILLNTLHRLLPPLIASRLEHRPGEPEHNELRLFLACLAQVSDFNSGTSIPYRTWRKFLHKTWQLLWHNTAAIERPALPDDLREELKKLRESDDMSLRDATEAVWRSYPAIEHEKHVSQGEHEA